MFSPVRLIAHRSPKLANFFLSEFTLKDLALSFIFEGISQISSPSCTSPSATVPVAIKPVPWSRNLLSTESLNSPCVVAFRFSLKSSSIFCFTSSMPAPDAEDAGMIGQS